MKVKEAIVFLLNLVRCLLKSQQTCLVNTNQLHVAIQLILKFLVKINSLMTKCILKRLCQFQQCFLNTVNFLYKYTNEFVAHIDFDGVRTEALTSSPAVSCHLWPDRSHHFNVPPSPTSSAELLCCRVSPHTHPGDAGHSAGSCCCVSQCWRGRDCNRNVLIIFCLDTCSVWRFTSLHIMIWRMSDQFWKAKNDYRRSQLDVTILIVESSSLEVGYLIYIHSCTVSANFNNMLSQDRLSHIHTFLHRLC